MNPFKWIPLIGFLQPDTLQEVMILLAPLSPLLGSILNLVSEDTLNIRLGYNISCLGANQHMFINVKVIFVNEIQNIYTKE